jgi:hypothetical protein
MTCCDILAPAAGEANRLDITLDKESRRYEAGWLILLSNHHTGWPLASIDSSPLASVYKSGLIPEANIGITQPPADDLARPSQLATKMDWTP